jgi:hypothetical protein
LGGNVSFNDLQIFPVLRLNLAKLEVVANVIDTTIVN